MAAEWLARAAAAIGMNRASGKVLHLTPFSARDYADESDRPYPPFAQEIARHDRWLDPVTGVEVSPGGTGLVVAGARSAYRTTPSGFAPASDVNATLRPRRNFDAWAIVSDWSSDRSVRVVARCPYADFERVVLARRGPVGEERLFVDPRSGFPMKLETVEFNYFLGPVHDEYRYTVWSNIAPFVYYPASTIKLSDGLGSQSWFALGGLGASLVSRDSAPPLALPDTMAMPFSFPSRFSADDPDTVRVGTATFLLVNRSFTSVLTLAHDTVYILDAPGGEERALRDSAWIGKLFPGRHAVTLVLVNAVWPHIAGLRFWVASGARVVGPRVAELLVQSAVARRWTERPDRLERARTGKRLRFTSVGDSFTLADGALHLHALDGAGSEGLLFAYVRDGRFVWASDRIQTIDAPSLYTVELARAVKRAGIQPVWTSGPHFRLIPWSQVERLTVAGNFPARQDPPDTATSPASTLFASLAGRWSCTGGFGRGGALQADLTFMLVAGGRALAFQHVDRSPSVYWQSATWGLESGTDRIVSLAMAGSMKAGAGTPSMFVASRWSATSLTLVADTLKAPPFAPNQFTYTVSGANTMKVVWEVSRNGALVVGDSLMCAR